jgi:segregation and condensation protein B
MDYFGINSAEELPKIKEVIPDNIVLPTMMNEVETGEEAIAETLAVSEGGDLIINEDTSEAGE